MGCENSKCPPCDNSGVSEIEEGGFHLVELHIPTAKVGAGIFVAGAIVIGFTVALVRCICRRRQAQWERHQQQQQQVHYARRGSPERVSLYMRALERVRRGGHAPLPHTTSSNRRYRQRRASLSDTGISTRSQSLASVDPRGQPQHPQQQRPYYDGSSLP